MFTTLDLVKDPMTTKAAAELLSVSRWAVLKAIHEDRIKAEQFGRDYWIERQEVERYLRERRLTGPRKRQPRPPA